MQIAVLALTFVPLLWTATLLPRYVSYFNQLSEWEINHIQTVEAGAGSNPTSHPRDVEQERRTLRSFFQTALVGGLIAGGVLLTAEYVLIVLGTLLRWTWWFWVQLVLAGIGALNIVYSSLLALGFQPGVQPGQPRFSFTPADFAVLFTVSLAWAATFVWMIVAYRRYGPWACRKVPILPQ